MTKTNHDNESLSVFQLPLQKEFTAATEIAK